MSIERQGGRINQKRRTRAALVTAAAELIAADRAPTITEVADYADISRATAYRYFSSQEHLLTEAMLEQALPAIDRVVDGWGSDDDAESRVVQLVEVVLTTVIEHEATFRAMLSASLAADANDGPARGGRRLRWIERALEPAASDLPPATHHHIVATLTPFLGIETLVALCDIAELNRRDAIDSARWAATAIVRMAWVEHTGADVRSNE